MRAAAAVLLCSVVLLACSESPPRDSGEEPPGAPESPKVVKVKMETSAGDVLIEVRRDWAPLGAARFLELVEKDFFDGCRFFRVVPGFVVQFGLNGDPAVNQRWELRTLRDEPVRRTNERGTLAFAKAGPDTRTTQIFVNLGRNAQLDGMGFSPFAKVVSGMDVIDRINAEYGQRPDQGRIVNLGNDYLRREFPNLDFVEEATVVE